MSTYLKRTSALAAALLLALAVGFGLASVQKAYADEGGGLAAAGLQGQSALDEQAYYHSDVVAAPVTNYAEDGAEAVVDMGLDIEASTYYTNSTKNKLFNEDGTPKDVEVFVTSDQLQKVRNADGTQGYRLGLGIPAAEGNQYAFGFGACPDEPTFGAASGGSFEQDGTTYDGFYFADESSLSGKYAYIVVKNAAGNVTRYSIDMTDVYASTDLARGLYEVNGLECDTGMILLDNADSKAYIKVDNGEAKLLVRIYGANKYDYIFMGRVADRPDTTDPAAMSAEDAAKMVKGFPVIADAEYIANGAQKSQIFTDKDGVVGAAGMKYKAMYFELPITQADIAEKSVAITMRRAAWGPGNPLQWMGSSDHFLTFDSFAEATDQYGAVDANATDFDIAEAITLTNQISLEPTADDLDAYAKAYTAYGALDYSHNDNQRYFLDMMIPEVAQKLKLADEAIPNIVPADGTYTFTQTLDSYNYPSVAEGLYSDSLYSAVLKVENGKMTVTVAQRRGTYQWMYLGLPTDAKAAQTAAGKIDETVPGVVPFQNETEVWLDHAAGTIGPDGTHSDDTPGKYMMYTATFELQSLEKPIMLSWTTSGSTWYNRSFIFHQANMGPEAAMGALRSIRTLFNAPDQDDPEVTKPLYRVDPAKVTLDDAEAIEAAQASYDALSDDDKAFLDSKVIEYGTQSYGRVLESAVWGLEAAKPLDNSTKLKDGDYTKNYYVTSSKGKSTSEKERTWTLTKITVKDGKATGILKSNQSSTFTSVKLNGQEYANTAAEGANSQFEIPVALGSTMSFAATSSTAKGSIAYQLTVTEKAANPMKVTSKNPAAYSFQVAAKTLANPLKVTGAKGAVTYAKASGAKNFTVNAKTGKITVAKNTAVGKYAIKITAKAAGDAKTKAGSVTKAVTIQIKKVKNTFAAKALKAKQTIKVGKTLAGNKAFKVTKNVSKGAVSYKKVKGNAKITVNAKNGTITVKKGLKPGNYPIQVKLTSKATKNYLAGNVTVKLTVVVK